MAIRFFDMFSGIGCFRSGLEAVGGFECIGHCEIDKYANQAYNAIYEPKGELYFEDARTINPNDLPDIDLICAGFPCQSFSLAGKRLGFADDTRGTLFFEVARIAEAKRPAYLLLENVPGLLSHDGGRTLDTIFSTLTELGYDLEWCVHNSANFGVPQQRRRLYIVASLGGRCTGRIFPLTCGNAENLKELISGPQGQRVYETNGVACTQCAGSGGWGGKTGLYFIDMNANPIITDTARLPPDHKARWFAGAALSAGDQAMASVMSTALSRLNSFLDTEMEQVLCFDTAVDAERFCQEKSAIFVVMPEENPNAYFMISLLIQQLYREILSVADENGGKLPNRVMFYCDEFGTMPPIQSAEMMYSASRSRRLSIVSIIQSYQQLEKNYGREGAAIIQDNCQITIAGGFAPTSETADIVSKTLGSRTVLTGSVSRSKNDPSQSLQMTERPLMSADELKNMKKGSFIVMKTGTHPFVSPLKLFFKWGISFSDTPYTVAEHGARKVCYVSRAKIIQAITSQFPQAKKPQPKTEPNNGGPDMTERQPKVPATVRTG